MICYLDGNPVLYPNDTLLYPKFTLRRKDDTGDTVISLTGDLEFTDGDRDYIFNKLVTDPNAPNNFVELKFVDDCCATPTTYLFQIKPESLEWCEFNQCTLKAAGVEYSVESQQYACMENTLIYDNYAGFQNQSHPRITYCLEFRPSILQDAMIIICLLLDAILVVLSPIIVVIGIIVTIINAIITFINVLGANLNTIGNNINGGVFNWALNFFQNFNEFFIGCGRRHPSPLVRAYALNVCNKCGIGFQSSIFNDPASDYYNTVYFNAPVKKGVKSTSSTYWIDENKPLLNGKRFFDEIKQPHNAQWRIKNNTLIFERKDYFQNTAPWVDLTTLTEDEVDSICWSWSGKTKPAYGMFMYTTEAIDAIANEARDRWNDIVEWNSPPNPVQKGEFTVQLPYSAARFRDDGVERDVLSDYHNWPLVGPVISQYGNVMLMNNGTCATPKLLIWDTATPVSEAKVRIFYPPPINAALNQHYNYPYWFDEDTAGNLYDRFWSIENPRSMAFRGFEFKATIVLTCARAAAIDVDGSVNTIYGLGQVTSVDVDYQSGRMTITGTV